MVVFADVAITKDIVPTYLLNDYQKLLEQFEHATLSDIHIMVLDYIGEENPGGIRSTDHFRTVMEKHPEMCDDVLFFINKINQNSKIDTYLSKPLVLKSIVDEVRRKHLGIPL